MKRYRWTHGVIGAILFAAAGCGEGTESPNPLSPSAESVPQTVVVEQQGECSLDGSPACFSPDLNRGITTTGQALTSAPINLKASVSGTSVTLSWTKPGSGTPTSYRLEAGTGPGKKDIADFNVGNTTSRKVSNLAPRKYLRTRARCGRKRDGPCVE